MNIDFFDVNLFNKLCKSTDKNKNIFISPVSISLALSMLILGSKRTTKQQPKEALGVDIFKKVLGKIKKLNVLNGL